MLTDCCESEPIALVLVFRVGRVVLFSMMAVVWNCPAVGWPAAKQSIAHVVRVARPPTNKHTTVYSCCCCCFFFSTIGLYSPLFPFRFLHFPPFCFVLFSCFNKEILGSAICIVLIVNGFIQPRLSHRLVTRVYKYNNNNSNNYMIIIIGLNKFFLPSQWN